MVVVEGEAEAVDDARIVDRHEVNDGIVIGLFDGTPSTMATARADALDSVVSVGGEIDSGEVVVEAD